MSECQTKQLSQFLKDKMTQNGDTALLKVVVSEGYSLTTELERSRGNVFIDPTPELTLYAWSEDYVYFIYVEECWAWIESVPRNPCELKEIK